jgi:hypothetical protein
MLIDRLGVTLRFWITCGSIVGITVFVVWLLWYVDAPLYVYLAFPLVAQGVEVGHLRRKVRILDRQLLLMNVQIQRDKRKG